jgi:catecholate siderophore receptor
MSKTKSPFIVAKKHNVAQQLKVSALSSMMLLAASGAMAADDTKKDDKKTENTKLSTVKVNADAINADFKADKVSSDKFTQPLVDTPQTIVVVKKELFQQQAATSLSETLRNTPGITMLLGENGNTATGDSIFMRGFDTQGSIFVDGIRDLGSISRDTFNTEQVEIAKGPAGVDNGRGAASGYINLSSKKATLDDAISGNVTLGTADYKRSTLDVNKSLNETSALRVNLLVQDAGVDGRDVVENKSLGLATSLGLGLGTETRTYLNFYHVQQRGIPDGGVPTAGLEGYYSSTYATAFPTGGPAIAKVDSETYFGHSDDHNDVDATMATVRIEHDLSDGVTLRNTSRYGRSTQDLVLTGVNALTFPAATKTDPNTWEVALTRQGRDQSNQILTNQTNLSASFETGGIKHDVASGLEFIYESQFSDAVGLPFQSATSATRVTQQNGKLYDFNSANVVYQPVVKDGTKTDGETTTSALYVLDTISLNDQWQVSAGLRAERFYTKTDQITRQAAVTSGTQTVPIGTYLGREAELDDNLISWKLGGVYKPAENGSIYLSYATSQLPPGSANFALSTDPTATISANTPNLDPQKGTNQELGTKWNINGNKLAVTAAVFKSTNDNEIATNDDGSTVAVGQREVKGLELGLSGIVMQNWQISAGFAYMDPKITRGNRSTASANASQTDGGVIQWSPKYTFTLWNSYLFSNGLTIAGGARYIDSVASSSLTDATAQSHRSILNVPEYWVFDAMASYAVTKNVTIQLNVLNLADEEYIGSLNNSGARYYPGAPRSVRLGANFSF